MPKGQPAKRSVRSRKKKLDFGDSHLLLRETPAHRYYANVNYVLAARRIADDFRQDDHREYPLIQPVYQPVGWLTALMENLAVWWCKRRHHRTTFTGGTVYQCGNCFRTYRVPWAESDIRPYQPVFVGVPLDQISWPEQKKNIYDFESTDLETIG